MKRNALADWHALVKSRDARALDSVLADSVVFHSPVVHTPQAGKAITRQYLAAALQVFFNDTFTYVREVSGPNDAVLEFQVMIDGISVNGVDMLKWDDAGKITEFKVMIRPLNAINLIHQKMIGFSCRLTSSTIFRCCSASSPCCSPSLPCSSPNAPCCSANFPMCTDRSACSLPVAA
jgi:SnoaL-like domain